MMTPITIKPTVVNKILRLFSAGKYVEKKTIPFESQLTSATARHRQLKAQNKKNVTPTPSVPPAKIQKPSKAFRVESRIHQVRSNARSLNRAMFNDKIEGDIAGLPMVGGRIKRKTAKEITIDDKGKGSVVLNISATARYRKEKANPLFDPNAIVENSTKVSSETSDIRYHKEIEEINVNQKENETTVQTSNAMNIDDQVEPALTKDDQKVNKDFVEEDETSKVEVQSPIIKNLADNEPPTTSPIHNLVRFASVLVIGGTVGIKYFEPIAEFLN